MDEGTTWTQGGPEPVTTITEGATLWTTPAANPCSQCAANDQQVYLDPPDLPAHNYCSCHGTSIEVTFTFSERVMAGESTDRVREYAGYVPGTYGGQERTRTFNLPNGDTQTEECPLPDMQLGAGKTRCDVYWVFEVTTTTLVDRYTPSQPVADGPYEKNNEKVVVRFLAQETEMA